jgi:hypothetical protein
MAHLLALYRSIRTLDHANCVVHPQPETEGVVQLATTAKKMVPDARAGVTIRMATEADTRALHRLAASDSTSFDGARTLVAEVGNELWAAVSLEDGAMMADPFRPSAELLFLLAERARQLEAPARARRLRPLAFALRKRRAGPAT